MDKYVYVTIHGRFSPRYLLKYSALEEVEQRGRDSAPLDSRIHPAGGPRPALPRNHQHGRHSRRNRVGLVGQLYHGPAQGAAPAEKNLVSPSQLAEQACHIEIDVLGEPVGKQDQYIAAFGGIHCFCFLNNGQVEASPLALSEETLYNLEDNLVLFFTGVTRSAGSILKEQDEKSRRNDTK